MNKSVQLLCCLIMLFHPLVGWPRTSVAELESRIEELEIKLKSNLSWELSNKIEFLQREIQDLRGTVEEQQHLITILTKSINPKESKTVFEQTAYDSAYKLIENKNFTEAIVAFKDFLLQYNNSKYVPHATYWLGELYLTDHRFDIAADYFLQVVNQYKGHDKAPDALLKLGMLEVERENWQGAKDYFMQIKQDYSNSTRVQMADAKLQSLQRDGH